MSEPAGAALPGQYSPHGPTPGSDAGATREGDASERPQASEQGKQSRLRQLCGTVLIMEAVVITLAISPAIVLEHVHGAIAGGVGGGLALCALLLGGLVGRPGMRWALAAGTVLQVLVIAAGAAVPAMYFLGAVFGALWVTGIWLARRIERQNAAAAPSR